MIDEFLIDIQELKEYKHKYECVQKDKQKMSDLLFELMTNEYERTSYEDRKEHYKHDSCRDCRGYGYCELEIPQDIGKPIKSDTAWIPATKSCGHFEWS